MKSQAIHYYDAHSFGEKARAQANRKKGATAILRRDPTPRPLVTEYMHRGTVQRVIEAQMKKVGRAAYGALMKHLPQHVQVNAFRPNGFGHSEIEHLGFTHIGSISTVYKGEPVTVVIRGANFTADPFFTEDGKQRFRNLPKSALDDKARQTPMYWATMHSEDGKPSLHHNNGIVFKTGSFQEVVLRCCQMIPKPQQKQSYEKAAEPAPRRAYG